ncbi:MFS transporter [Vitiosangium sp. GDMCC 1.1324]|uniref:MFS transporter n=1 Tax=Vitiosangium sp. (strain GDMCC 1.1324) TaxID=2138576 RepID=UPI00130DC6E3|nr:MFS transporter [Vitiosangium sp. GDMCC 1.1324]
MNLFRQPNVQLVFLGRLSVLMADVIQDVSLIWIVWELTHSSAATAVASMSSRIPLWLFSLPAGSHADSAPPRRTIIAANLICAVLALLLVGFANLGWMNVPLLCLVAFAISTCRTFEAPSFYSLVRGLSQEGVDTQQLNGVADTAKRTARLTGPLLANALRSVIPVFNIYAFIGLFYAGMAYAGRQLNVREFRSERKQRKGLVADLREAMVVIRQQPTLQYIILAECLFNASYGACYYVFLPRLTMDTTGGGTAGHASAVTAFGLGGLVAGFFSTRLKMGKNALNFATVAWIGIGAAFGLMYFATTLPMIVFLTALAGAAMAIQTIALWSGLHAACPPEHSGRVYSIWRLGADTAITVSTLIAGVVADAFGPTVPIGVVGVYVFFAILIARRFTLHRSVAPAPTLS